MALKTTHSHSYDSIQNLAVSLTGSESQRHLGMLIRHEDGSLKWIHLGWYNRFSCEKPPVSAGWIECQHLLGDIEELFVDWLFAVWDANGGKIPYGFCYSPNEDYFSLDWSYVNSEPGKGLTCATFVLECFKQFDIYLVEHDTWQYRDDDRLWKEGILEMLRLHAYSTNTPQEHISMLEKNIDEDARFRPEEVAAAAVQYNGVPLTFNEVIPLSEALLLEFKSFLCGGN